MADRPRQHRAGTVEYALRPAAGTDRERTTVASSVECAGHCAVIGSIYHSIAIDIARRIGASVVETLEHNNDIEDIQFTVAAGVRDALTRTQHRDFVFSDLPPVCELVIDLTCRTLWHQINTRH